MSGGHDPTMLAGFFEESDERLASLDPLFVRIEADPTDREAIEAIFRAIHTIKGNCGFFGFDRIKELAHAVEDVLDGVRAGRLVLAGPIADDVLAGADALRRMLDRLHAGGAEIEDADAHAALVGRQREHLRQVARTLTADPRTAAIDRLSRALRDLPAGQVQEAWRALLPLIAPADAAPPAELAVLRRLAAPDGARDAAAAAALRQALRSLASRAGDPDSRGLLRRLNTEIEELLEATGFADVVADLVRDRLDGLPATMYWAAAAGTDEVPLPSRDTGSGTALQASAPETTASHAAGREPRTDRHEHRTDVFTRADGKKTLRVPEDRIDTFLSHVGDLLVVSDLFRHLLARLGDGGGLAEDGRRLATDLRRAVSDFDRLSGSLQQAIMRVRQVQVKSLLAKVPRLVRDVARARGKTIAVRTFGEEIEIDKALCDLLDAPLVHLVRNAADHGVEEPRARTARGKPIEGTIVVGIALTDRWVVLTIEDDGAGLDHARIRGKAIERGIIAPDAVLSGQELDLMIFAPGFSTAATVTEISGRGVGLDVVRTAVEGAGGTVAVANRPGKGCTFTVSVPRAVSTQILPGFMVAVSGLRLVLPLGAVRETASVPRSALSVIPGRGPCLIRHEHVISIVDLRTRLGFDDPGDPSLLAVTVEVRGALVAMVVDQVLGVQQVVLRPIQGVGGIPAGFAGGALLGDGTVALVAEIEHLVAAG